MHRRQNIKLDVLLNRVASIRLYADNDHVLQTNGILHRRNCSGSGRSHICSSTSDGELYYRSVCRPYLFQRCGEGLVPELHLLHRPHQDPLREHGVSRRNNLLREGIAK